MKIKETLGRISRKLGSFRKVLKGQKSVDKIYSSQHFFANEELAIKGLEDAKRKLFQVNLWNVLSGPENAKFTLYNAEGEPYRSPMPRVNDYIKIVLPGPFPENWVQVIEVIEEEDFAQFTVHPSEDPTNPEEPEIVTEHFFKSKATSTFKVERKGKKIIAYEIGKDEEINKQTPESGNRSALNTVIAGGGWAAFQKIQWKNLTNFLVGNRT